MLRYTIYYDPVEPSREPVKATRFGMVGVVVILLVWAAALGAMLPDEVTQLRQRLLPWSEPEAGEAFSAFRLDLEQGQTFRDALGELCVRILDSDEG